AKKLDLDFSKAEKAKIICGFDSRIGKGVIKKILEPELKKLATKITESINFYQREHSDQKKVEKIILTGGVSRMKKIAEELNKLLDVKIENGNPYTNLPLLNKMQKIPQNKISSYPTALGLALRIK
ncbi:MAG: hypothetical protein ACD_12C00591G0006, partial [uncultured bacterium]